MMIFMNLAWHNLLRNQTRSMATLAAITLGIAMLVFTNGFTNGISANMSDTIIKQIDGHIRIEHRDYKKFFMSDPEKIVLQDYSSLVAQLRKIPHVQAVMPRVMFGGLLGIREKNSTFIGSANELATLQQVLPDYGSHLVSGALLSETDPNGVVLGAALAESLHLNINDELVLLSKTIHGEQSNTLVHVRGTIRFPTDKLLEESLLLSSLSPAIREDLLDLGNGASQLIVRLDDTATTAETAQAIERLFAEQHLPLQVTVWYDNPSFSRIVGVFNGIGGVVMIILVLMVGIITSNALLMAFFERMREIGTLRAIGMNRFQLSLLLYLETCMLGLTGAISGLILGLAMIFITQFIGIPIGVIGESVYPAIKLSSLLTSSLVPVFFILLAAYLPIQASKKLSVIEALNYQ